MCYGVHLLFQYNNVDENQEDIGNYFIKNKLLISK